MVDQLYGFRPLPKSKYYKTDDVVQTADPRVPELNQPQAKQELSSASNTRMNDYSGTSAENEDSGPGSSFKNGGTDPAMAHYASQEEALQYGKAGWDNGYYGTVQDAAAASKKGNAAATGTLQGFLSAGPSGLKSAPGTFGFLGTQLDRGLNGGKQYDTRNISDSLSSLSESGDLYNNDNSSGYFGDSIQQQQTISDVDATNTWGNVEGKQTLQQMQGPEIFHSLTPDPVQQVAEQQANYDHYQDNSSDDNHGQTDGSQTGAETSHAGGYGGYADDTAATNSDSGGGGGGK
ncbi:MAG: hypothetical protein K0U78_19865 [Actinomycetia bacterium]|nr:hypothetical protein [Actinomycetes bacterium]